MTIWTVAPVNEAPEIGLITWQIFETDKGERHFVGYNITHGEGRASSAIVTFDPVTKTGITSSGRVYALRGSPGLNLDAEYVWRRWCSINGVTHHEDVTATMMAKPSEGQDT